MGEIISLPTRPTPRLAAINQDELAIAIMAAEHRLVAEALENIASANLELQALNRIALLGDTDRVGDLVNDEIMISLANAVIHLVGARGNLTGDQPARIALLQMVERLEGRRDG